MKLKLRFLIKIPTFIILIGLFAISTATFTLAKGTGYWKYSGKQIQWVEPFLPENVTTIRDIPWNKVFQKGTISTTYLGQEYDVTRRYQGKGWAEPLQSRRFTWSLMPDVIRPGETYPILVSSSGNGFGSLDISRLTNTKESISWLATAIKSRVSLEIKTTPPTSLQNPETRMILIHLGCGASGTDTFNYVNYVYIYKWING